MTLIHPHENFTSAKDIQQGGLVLLYVQYIYMGCYYTLNFVVSHMSHVTTKVYMILRSLECTFIKFSIAV